MTATDGDGGPADPGGSTLAALGFSPPDQADDGTTVAVESAAKAPAGGRRRRVQGGRSKRVVVRLTEEEHSVLVERAAAAGVSVPRFLIECGLDPTGVSPAERRAKFATFMAVRRTLAGAATNLNQLARWANTEHQWPVGAAPAADAVAVAAARLEVAIGELEQ